MTQIVYSDKYLEAMKAGSIPEGWSNLWFVKKASFASPLATERHGKPVILPPGNYTFLHRITDATLYADPPGETVMEDTPFELRTHLGFVLQAKGRVLVTGLGLGCVIRGLLLNPAVEHVTCIENSADVLKLVGPYIQHERLTLVCADALEWTAKNTERFDCAWHDVWTNRSDGEPHLDLWHARLLTNCKGRVASQGAWAFDRAMKKYLTRHGFKWIG